MENQLIRRAVKSIVSLILPALCVWAITGAVFAAGAVVGAGAAVAAEKIGVRAWEHAEFGRIVFDWPTTVRHSAEVSGTTLTIRFDRKFKADLQPVARKLQKYISNISLGADGKSITAKLTKAFRMRSFINEGAIVVDLAARPRSGSWAAATAPPPVVKPPKPVATKAAAKPAPPRKTAPPPRLNVRTGEHPGYNRLVFDWTGAVGYKVGRGDGKFDIRFNRAATIDAAKLRRKLRKLVTAIEVANKGRGLRVGLRLKPGVRVRHFRDGTRVVVDVLAGVATTAKKSKKSDKPQASGRPVSLTKLASQKKARAKAKARAKRRARRAQKKFGPKAALVTVRVVRQSPNKLNARFNWRRAVAAAFYRRNGNIWIYFDEAARIDLGGLKTLGDGMIESVQQYQVPKGALVRVGVSSRYAPVVQNIRGSWVLDIGPRRFTKLKKPIEIKVEAGDQAGPRVIAALPNPGPLVMLRDPEVGDVIGIVPVKSAGYGVEKPRRFIDFTLFSSALGVAYRPLTEGLQVASAKSGVVFSGPRGLRISRAEDIARGVASAAGGSDSRLLWNIEAWRRGTSEQIDEMRGTLLRRVVAASPARRNNARIDLAKFYFSNGRAADALGIIDVVSRQKPTRDQKLVLRSLRAATKYLLNHYGEAEQDFDDPNLKAEQGAIPWLGALAAAKGNWRDAHEKFLAADKVTELYPIWLRRRFLLLAAEAALVSGNSDTASAYLKSLNTLAPLPEQKADIEYLRGYLLKRAGKLDQAKRLWGTLANSRNRPVRAKAMFAIVEADLEQKKIDRLEAIKRLEDLSFAWRGDVFEFDLLRRLGELYIAENNYREGFTRLRQAASYFKKVEGAEGVTELMNSYFRKLYLGGVADKLPPVTALALFEEFRELAPAGSDGDEMIRKLADRLAKVDLLDDAAKLLDHQVEFRLDGAEKARIGLRAAIIRLLDDKPEKGLATLNDSEVPDMPVALDRQRRYLKANILGKLERLDEAMALLVGDFSDEADKTRIGILWRKAKWPEVSIVLQRTLSKRELTAKDEEGARLVMQWVIARSMLGDNAGIETLRDRFGDIMAKTSQAKAFKVLVGNDLDGIADYPTLVKAAGDIDRLQAFMSQYRGYIRDPEPSAIN
jgi:hypothetical protein